MNKQLLWLPAAAFSVALLGQITFYRFGEMPVANNEASWVFHPKNVAEASARANTVVQGKIVSVSPGADIVTKAPGEPNNEDRIPTQHIQLAVSSVQKGKVRIGQVLDVFQTGGLVGPTDKPSGKDAERVQTHLVLLNGDPLYKVGEQYMLMLEDGPSGMLRTVSPEGRYRIEANATVTPMVDNEVTTSLKGVSVSQLVKLSAL